MKHILYLFFFFFTYFGFAQTKLINHKSHSGTNKTFNPHKVEGNFGLPDYLFIETILEDKKSKYLLTRKKAYSNKDLIYVLETKQKKETYSSENTIASVTITKKNQEENFIKSVEALLIKKLKELRKAEK